MTVNTKRPNTHLIGLRLNAGLSPNDLGRRCGISGETVRLCEAGHVPLPRTQFAIAHELGVDVLTIWPLERQPVMA